MQEAQIPVTKFQVPFANSAVAPYVLNPIPVDSQIGVTAGAASLHDGFPPVNFIPVSAGGTPFFGKDMNGILLMISSWVWWANGGNSILPYDATYQTAVGGYAKGAFVAHPVTAGLYYRSTADSNVTNPTSGGAGWESFGLGASGVTPGSYTLANITVGSDGRVTSAANGSVPASGVTPGTYLLANIIVGSDGRITAAGNGSVPASGVTPGSYTLTNITVGADGRITAAANGSVPASGVTPGAYTKANITVGADGRVTAAASGAVPTYNALGSPGTATYNTPAGCRQLRIRMIAGGGGGRGGANGNAGATTSFGSISAGGGQGGTLSAGGAGGQGGSGSASLRVRGGNGGSPSSVGTTATTPTGSISMVLAGGVGGGGPFGGNGSGAGAPNTGAGGAGFDATGTNPLLSGGGGGAGEYVETTIDNPDASYSYTVGAGGTSSGGNAGGVGVILIEEIY